MGSGGESQRHSLAGSRRQRRHLTRSTELARQETGQKNSQLPPITRTADTMGSCAVLVAEGALEQPLGYSSNSIVDSPPFLSIDAARIAC